MTITVVNPATLQKPRGFSHGIVAQGTRMLFLAGQPGVDATGRIAAPGDLVEQFTQALANLDTVVREAGGTTQNIVKLTIFVVDKNAYIDLLKPLGEVYRSQFGKHYPAMTLVEVRNLFDDNALIEIEGIAVLD
jgi:enamine deaminase RidA (YjgF/YER057c/UK114 family)